MDCLTPRQEQILQFIRQSSQDKGFSPSIREIARHFGVSSPNAIHGHLKALREKGRLDDMGSAHRALRPADLKPTVQVPLVGQVRAGLPVLAEENVESYLSVDRDVARGGKLFALKVAGDSMRNAGILDGDTVIVRVQEQAQNGDIVVALKEGEATVKHYRHRRSGVFLEPDNPAYKPFPLEGFSIIGIVRGLVRSYPR